MPHTFVSPYFLGSQAAEGAEIALFGVCWDGTSSFKAGSRFAGFAVREASFGLEEFSFYQQESLVDIKFTDFGDLFLPPAQKERVLESIGSAAREIRAKGLFPIAFGGEHLVALPLILAAHEAHPTMALIHFDAHADLRPTMLGDPLTHATIIGRAADVLGYDNLFQFGIRSGGAEEWALAQKHRTMRPFTVEAIQAVLATLGDRPIYITLDMDVLDPSLYPGTGTPEPGGIDYNTLMAGLKCFQGRNLVGMDCLELAPHYDPTGVSAITMAKTLRELIILAHKRRNPVPA
jgi:agmatinase